MEARNFEEYLRIRGYSKETIKTYVFQVTPFVERFTGLSQFTYKQVHEALVKYLKNHTNQNYKNSILCSVKKYYDYLMETGIRNDHPCRTMRFKTIRKKGMVHSDLFTGQELELLLEREERYPVLKFRNQLIVSLLIYQGLQIRELINLKLQHLNLEGGKIYVKESRMASSRYLELHPLQYEILEQYLNQARPELLKVKTDQLLVGMRGTPITKDDIQYVIETFKPLFPDRNLTPEVIRQSVIANWLNHYKLSLEQVQLMAGHKWVSTTVRYRQQNIADKRALINKMNLLN